MGENTKIEWCHHTFNPWIGCQHVSPGCDNCYAETLMDKRYGKVQWGPHGARVRTGKANWKLPLRWAKAARVLDYRPRVFCASLADWLDNKAPEQWREDLACLIEATPELDWLLLTKRIENFDKLAPWHHDDIPPNVWMGVTAETQDHFLRRWSFLREIKARVLFISYEPALGPLWFRPSLPDWIICGGESGIGAREMNPEWAREVRDQCAATGTKFFMKQMTGRAPIPRDLQIRQVPLSG